MPRRANLTRRKPERDPMPEFVPRMEPKLVKEIPVKGDWRAEWKFDGYWMQAHVRDGAATLLSSSGANWTKRFGSQIAAGMASLPVSTAILDAEVILLTKEGAVDFDGLHAMMRSPWPARDQTARLTAVAFDLLYLDGEDLRRRPLVDRRRLLQELMTKARPPIEFSPTLDEDPAELLAAICGQGAEGIVLKQADSIRRPGPTDRWLKLKCVEEKAMVIGGWLPSGPLNRIGALLVGQYDGSRLRYLGRVGTGITDAAAAELAERLGRRAEKTSPFHAGTMSPKTRRAARFVRPELVADVAVRGWTADGKLRHSSYRSLRADKRPQSVKIDS